MAKGKSISAAGTVRVGSTWMQLLRSRWIQSCRRWSCTAKLIRSRPIRNAVHKIAKAIFNHFPVVGKGDVQRISEFVTP
jgi:hypothetical protein